MSRDQNCGKLSIMTRDFLGAKTYETPTRGYASELRIDTYLDPATYKSPSPNEARTDFMLFGRGCSAKGCPLVIPLDMSLPEALTAFHNHNEADHDELYPQRMIFLYRESPADPNLGTGEEGVVK